jgi:hypothetical protein
LTVYVRIRYVVVEDNMIEIRDGRCRNPTV